MQKPEAEVGGVGLASVQAVTAQGWAAVEAIAAIARDYTMEWSHTAHWLHIHRGNEFVHHVVREMSGEHYKTTKYPIVLLHGFNAAPGDSMSFADAIPAGMRGDGDAVFQVTPPFQSVAERAGDRQRTGFDAVEFYRRMAGGVAKRGY